MSENCNSMITGVKIAKIDTEWKITQKTIAVDSHSNRKRLRSNIPDGGWGWVVTACAFFTSLILIGIPLTFGIMFNEKLRDMGVSSTTTAWIFNLYNFFFNLSGVFTASLCDQFSWRSVGFIGCLITGISFALMMFAQSPVAIFIVFSVIIGISSGISSMLGFLAVPQYFDTNRGRASAVVVTGVASGQIILPLLLRELLVNFGFAGACLIFGGIILNCSVASLLVYNLEDRPVICGDALIFVEKSVTLEEKTEHCRSASATVQEVFRKTWYNMTMLKNMRLLVVTLSFSLFVTGYGNFVAVLPFAMTDSGHSLLDASYVLSCGAIANTVTRIFICCVSDSRWFSRKIAYFFGSTLATAATLGTIYSLSDVQQIMACQVAWSIGCGVNISVFHNFKIDTCGMDLYPAGVCVTGLLLAFCNLAIGPLVGVVRDYFSYKMSLLLVAVVQFLCTVCGATLPLALRHDRKYRRAS